MTPIRKGIALVGTLTIFTVLAACSQSGVMVPTEPVSLSAATVATLMTPVSEPSPFAGGEPAYETPGVEAIAADETCELFRQMVAGLNTLSSDEQQQLISEMIEVVQYSGSPDLMRAVADMGQGWLDGNPQQFARGMRALSTICNVPYE